RFESGGGYHFIDRWARDLDFISLNSEPEEPGASASTSRNRSAPARDVLAPQSGPTTDPRTAPLLLLPGARYRPGIVRRPARAPEVGCALRASHDPSGTTAHVARRPAPDSACRTRECLCRPSSARRPRVATESPAAVPGRSRGRTRPWRPGRL